MFQGVLVQEMAPPGKEVILGMKRDPHFGPIIMFGIGGVYVEALHDVTFRLAPIRELSARDMIRSIRAIGLLEGIRGEPASDTEAIAECLMRLSQMVMEHPEIAEMDINPLVVYPKGAKIIDARIIFTWEKAPPKAKERRFLPREHLSDFVAALSSRHQVYGPRAKDNCFVYGEISDPADLRLDYDTTILPPKKYFFKDQETLVSFSVGDNRVDEPVIDGTQVIFGVHPCDLIGIGLLDKVFSDGPGDRNYLRRRELSYLIGLNCGRKCNQFSYCDAMVCYKTDSTYDLMLTELDGGYTVEVGTERGADLLELADGVCTTELTAEQYRGLKQFERKREELFSERPVDFRTLARDLWKNYSSPLWRKQAELCFSCGVCNAVCPTCYCFDVCEETDVAGTCGDRKRAYDGCMLRDFTVVATGEVFREKREARLRHRELRKGLYLPEKYDFHTFCVGCGRCVKNCLVRISPLESFLEAQKERR
jgi:sulfhydrogenase subunit beta (sulfur reductase)